MKDELIKRLEAHDRQPNVADVRAFLSELGVLLEDIFDSSGSVPAYPNALVETLDLAASLVEDGEYIA